MILCCWPLRLMRVMLDTSDSYAKEFNIVFNANKSKCLFSSCKRRSKQNIGPNPLFEINGRTIEYVNEWPHLGHIISSNLNDEADIMQRRNIMAGQINNVLCYFGKLDRGVARVFGARGGRLPFGAPPPRLPQTPKKLCNSPKFAKSLKLLTKYSYMKTN